MVSLCGWSLSKALGLCDVGGRAQPRGSDVGRLPRIERGHSDGAMFHCGNVRADMRSVPPERVLNAHAHAQAL
jgi:hypothetical protein